MFCLNFQFRFLRMPEMMRLGSGAEGLIGTLDQIETEKIISGKTNICLDVEGAKENPPYLINRAETRPVQNPNRKSKRLDKLLFFHCRKYASSEKLLFFHEQNGFEPKHFENDRARHFDRVQEENLDFY